MSDDVYNRLVTEFREVCNAAMRQVAMDYIIALDDAVAHCVRVKSDHNDDDYEPYDRALTQVEAVLRAAAFKLDAALTPSAAPGEGETR